MHALTLGSFAAVTALVGLLTWLITRKDDTGSSAGYFLAGRSLSTPLIAGSLLLTNLSTEQLVGLNGAAFRDGLCVMVWEVMAVMALCAMALFFLPRFLRSGVATVPEYLRIRFDGQTELWTNAIFLLAYALILLPIILYTGATGMIGILDVKGLLGIASDGQALWLIVWAVGLIGSLYALWGGLRTVAVSDTLNGVGLLVGGLLITVYGLDAVGGGAGPLAGISALAAQAPEKLNSIGGATSSVPVSTIASGIMLLNLFYWCTNQQIIQRTFGASSLAEGQKGVLLTGALKLLGPLYLVLPGIMGFVLFAGTAGVAGAGAAGAGAVKADQIYGLLVRKVLPAPLTGFFAAAMLGAILSSFNSALNATCTLFSLGIYKVLWRPQASEKQVVRSGRLFGAGIALAAMSTAPFLAQTGSIFAYLQKMNGIYFVPILAVVLVGMLTRRVSPRAAKIGLVVGIVTIAVGYFVPPFDRIVASMHEFHFLGVVFAYLVVMMLIIGELSPTAEEFEQQDVGAVDLTPWPRAKLSAALLAIGVLLIYIAFADFGVLGATR